MKKVILLIYLGVLLCSFKAFSQLLPFTVDKASVESGGIVTITAKDENYTYSYKGDLTWDNNSIVTVPQGYYSFIKIEDLKMIQKFDYAGTKPTKYSFKISCSLPQDLDVTIFFKGTYQNGSATHDERVTIRVTQKVPEKLFYNDAQWDYFTKNDCPSGKGETIRYYIAKEEISSKISVDDANKQAIERINKNGQAYANSQGKCLVPNTTQYGEFTKNDCSNADGPGPALSYSIPANKFYAATQEQANQLAIAELNKLGQLNANMNGTCASSFSLNISTANVPDENGNYPRGTKIIVSFQFVSGQVPAGTLYELNVLSPDGETTVYGPQTSNTERISLGLGGLYRIMGRTISSTGVPSAWVQKIFFTSN